MTMMRKTALATVALGVCLSFSACASLGGKPGGPSAPASANTTDPEQDQKIPLSHLFGGGHSKKSDNDAQAGIGVNAYLWRASLDTISFMPLASADPWGGTIITDWYANPQKPDERFKVTVYILDSRLRADALSVSVYKQVQQNGQWTNADVSQQTQIDMENAILSKARELRLSDVK
ncbi:MAG TPA: DUF3576 domain-containing protein [Asticcacaulis sp.]|nr:DUF3576 domain-containing protein [Asticcacaulis sp.]